MHLRRKTGAERTEEKVGERCNGGQEEETDGGEKAKNDLHIPI